MWKKSEQGPNGFCDLSLVYFVLEDQMVKQ